MPTYTKAGHSNIMHVQFCLTSERASCLSSRGCRLHSFLVGCQHDSNTLCVLLSLFMFSILRRTAADSHQATTSLTPFNSSQNSFQTHFNVDVPDSLAYCWSNTFYFSEFAKNLSISLMLRLWALCYRVSFSQNGTKNSFKHKWLE